MAEASLPSIYLKRRVTLRSSGSRQHPERQHRGRSRLHLRPLSGCTEEYKARRTKTGDCLSDVSSSSTRLGRAPSRIPGQPDHLIELRIQ